MFSFHVFVHIVSDQCFKTVEILFQEVFKNYQFNSRMARSKRFQPTIISFKNLTISN